MVGQYIGFCLPLASLCVYFHVYRNDYIRFCVFVKCLCILSDILSYILNESYRAPVFVCVCAICVYSLITYETSFIWSKYLTHMKKIKIISSLKMLPTVFNISGLNVTPHSDL